MSGNFVLGGTTDSTGTTARIPAKSWTNWDLRREKKMVDKPVHKKTNNFGFRPVPTQTSQCTHETKDFG